VLFGTNILVGLSYVNSLSRALFRLSVTASNGTKPNVFNDSGIHSGQTSSST